MSLMVALCQPITARAEEGVTDETMLEITTEGLTLEGSEPLGGESMTEEIVVPPEVELVPEEGAILLGDFRLTYYCCEKRKHICGKGTGITASGRPVEPGRSIAVDPNIIPLGSRVFINFGDGEGWHEYSADDTGQQVEGNHIDISVGTHKEALHQSKILGQVYFVPPPCEIDPAM